MKLLKKIIVVLIFFTLGVLSITKSSEKSQKNFLKTNVDKVLKSNTVSLIQTKLESKSESSSIPIVGNHKLEANLSEDEKYEMERANAMAEFLF